MEVVRAILARVAGPAVATFARTTGVHVASDRSRAAVAACTRARLETVRVPFVTVGAHGAVASGVKLRWALTAIGAAPLVCAPLRDAIRVRLACVEALVAVGPNKARAAVVARVACPAVAALARAADGGVPGDCRRTATAIDGGAGLVAIRKTFVAVGAGAASVSRVEPRSALVTRETGPPIGADAMATGVLSAGHVGSVATAIGLRARPGTVRVALVARNASIAVSAGNERWAALACVAGPAVAAFARAAGIHVAGHARGVAVAAQTRRATLEAVGVFFVAVRTSSAILTDVELRVANVALYFCR